MLPSRPLLALLGLTLLPLSTGCIPPWIFDGGDDPPPVEEPEPAPVPPALPQFTSVDVPTWPPLGASDPLTVQVSSEEGLSNVAFAFPGATANVPVSGTSATATIFAGQLVEGYGTVRIDVVDTWSQVTSTYTDNVLIDLSPPLIDVGRTVLRADGVGGTGSLEAWVSDEWALGEVELHVGGEVHTEIVRTSMPTTVGQTWDAALVRFNASTFPVGTQFATLVARDGAGNEVSEPLTLTVDDQPPTAAFLSPAAHTAVSEPFEVTLEVLDDLEGPTRAVLLVEGDVVAEVDDPSQPVTLDPSEWPLGTTELQLVGYDEAGNPSAQAALLLEVMAPAPMP